MRLFKYAALLIFFTAVTLSGQKVIFAAAADMRFAMKELCDVYKQKVDSTLVIETIFGASGSLFQQASKGAPFDVLFSADNTYPQRLFEQKLTDGPPVLYAQGHLVLWSRSADVSTGPTVLRKPEIKHIAIANPDVAPYGKRAFECLRYYNLESELKDKIVRGDNVSQAAQFVLTGNAEAGLIALSLALSPEMKQKGKFYIIDAKSYQPLMQAYVVMKKAAENKKVKRFLAFLETPAGRAILDKYGFSRTEQPGQGK